MAHWAFRILAAPVSYWNGDNEMSNTSEGVFLTDLCIYGCSYSRRRSDEKVVMETSCGRVGRRNCYLLARHSRDLDTLVVAGAFGARLDRRQADGSRARFRGHDGRYLLFYENHDPDRYMHPVIVPGYDGAVDMVEAGRVGSREAASPGGIFVLGLGAFSRTVPPEVMELSAHSYGPDPHLQWEPHGFRFFNCFDSNISPSRARKAAYRVTFSAPTR